MMSQVEIPMAKRMIEPHVPVDKSRRTVRPSGATISATRSSPIGRVSRCSQGVCLSQSNVQRTGAAVQQPFYSVHTGEGRCPWLP